MRSIKVAHIERSTYSTFTHAISMWSNSEIRLPKERLQNDFQEELRSQAQSAQWWYMMISSKLITNDSIWFKLYFICVSLTFFNCDQNATPRALTPPMGQMGQFGLAPLFLARSARATQPAFEIPKLATFCQQSENHSSFVSDLEVFDSLWGQINFPFESEHHFSLDTLGPIPLIVV